MKTRKILSIFGAAALAFGTFTACTSDGEDNAGQEDLSAVAAKLQKLGFNTDELYTDTMNGVAGYVVERDIFLTMTDINSMSSAVSIDNKQVDSEHYRTTNIVSTPRVVNVYMDVDFRSDMQAAFDDALARYNSLGLDITFQRAANEGADIDILAARFRKVPGGGTILGRSAGFPDANGDPATPITLNQAVYNRKRGGIPADAATVIAHEIGHAIGFRHTDYFNRSYSCGSGGDEGDAGVGAVYIPGTPAGPENGSFMLACSNGTDRPFTSGDVTALTTVY